MEDSILCSGCSCKRKLSDYGFYRDERKKTCNYCKNLRDKRLYKCDFNDCNYTTNSKQHLKNHKLTHNKKHIYYCDICDYSTTIKYNIDKHKNVHNKQKYYCDKCEYSTIIKSHFHRHVKSIHNNVKDKICEYEDCDYKCSTMDSLNKHIKAVHMKIKDKICEYQDCDYKCSTTSNLIKHINQVHKNIRPYNCLYCDYKAYTPTILDVHNKRVHDNIKDIKCTYIACNKVFSTKGDLKQHLKYCDGTNNIKSSGEKKIEKYLIDNNFKYQYNTSYKVKNINLLQWDFIVELNEKKVMIEFNGRHHYEPVQYGGCSKEKAHERFIKQQENDIIKNNFCKDNDIKILWIPYYEYDNIEELLNNFLII